MKYIILLFLLVGIAYADEQLKAAINQDGSITFTLSAETAKQCKDNGGCAIMSRAEYELIVAERMKRECGTLI